MLGVESLHRWFFSTAGASLREARAPFLLCTIGWFLLTVFGLQTGIPEAWRIDLAAMCFGAGTFSYTVALVSILLNFSSGGKADVGQPSLFMLVAPPSVAAVGLASLRGRFDSAAASVLGCAPFVSVPWTLINWSCSVRCVCVDRMHSMVTSSLPSACLPPVVRRYAMLVLLLLLRTGLPKASGPPTLLGWHWACTFPTAALAKAAILYADANDTVVTTVLAVALVALATLILMAVIGQTIWQQLKVLRGVEEWRDPIAVRCLQGLQLQQAECACTRPAPACAYDGVPQTASACSAGTLPL